MLTLTAITTDGARGCSGCRADIPAAAPAYVDADGWLWCGACTLCECGKPADGVSFRRGSSEEIWQCRACGRRDARTLAAAGWLSQSAVLAASLTGIAIRRRMQARTGE